MSQMQSTFAAPARTGEGQMSTPNVVRLGLSLGTFFVISYVICIAGYLLLPGFPVHTRRFPSFCRGSNC
jgi:hypothetical protein